MGARPGVAFVISAQDDASLILNRVEGSAKRLTGEANTLGAVFGRTDGARKFSNALENIAFQSVGVSGKFGTMLQGLSSLSLGSPVMLGITAGITAFAGILSLLGHHTDEAKKKTDELIVSLLKEADIRSGKSIESPQGAYDAADRERRALQARIRAGGTMAAGEMMEHGITGPSFFRRDTASEVAAMNRQLDRLNAAALEASRRMTTLIGGASSTPGAGGRSGTGGRGGGAIQSWLDILQGMNKGSMPDTASPFRVQSPDAQNLVNPNTLQIQPPKELLDRLNFFQWSDQLSQMVGQQIGDTLGAAVSNAFTAAFSGEGVGGALAALGKTLLAGFGGILVSLGQAYISYGVAMASLVPSLANPFLAGPAAIAIGALMTGLGAALGAVAHGGGVSGGRAGGFSSNSFQQGSAFADGRKQIVYVNFSGKHATIDTTDPEDQAAFSGMLDELGDAGQRQIIYGTPTPRRA